MKASSEKSMDKPTAIVARTLLNLGEEARQRHWSLQSTKRVLRLHRSLTMPRDPTRLQDIIIQGEWAVLFFYMTMGLMRMNAC